jgi:hypothetical protein
MQQNRAQLTEQGINDPLLNTQETQQYQRFSNFRASNAHLRYRQGISVGDDEASRLETHLIGRNNSTTSSCNEAGG